MTAIRRMREEMHAKYPVDPERLERTKEYIAEARLVLAVKKGGWLSSHLLSMAEIIYHRDPQFETMAVMRINAEGDIDHDRTIMLVNVDFVHDELMTCDSEDPHAFAVNHERKHCSNMHLNKQAGGEAAKKSPHLWTIATEANINWDNEKSGFVIPSRGGKPIVVDPHAVHRQYVDAAKKAGVTPVAKREFLQSEYTLFNALDALPKPPALKMIAKACGTSKREKDGDDQENGGGSGLPIDDDLSGTMARVYSAAVRAAEAGDKNAEAEVLEDMEKFPEASDFWGSVGANKLRGRTATGSKASNLWMRYAKKRVRSILGEGTRWVWNRRLPSEDRFHPKGKQSRQSVAIFVDSSGSMPQDLIDRVATLVGSIPNTTVAWHWFDASVGPFEPGGEILGGGGTSFHAIEKHVNARGEDGDRCCRRRPDAVIVLTDGYAPEMIPVRPNRWVWLITPGGSMWPLEKGMAAYQVEV